VYDVDRIEALLDAGTRAMAGTNGAAAASPESSPLTGASR